MDMDSRSLKIFLKVIEENSFSGAARALHLTQPTVSQQMARLESELKGRLFERVGRDIHITALGKKLQAYALEVLESTERLRDELARERTQPTGLVRYAMPESCQWTPHFRRIMAQIRELPEMVFDIGILHSDEVLRAVMEGRADFGFAVGERVHPELRFEHFADEAYSAVAAQDALLKPLREKRFKDVRWISFPGWELFFDTWARGHGQGRVLKAALSPPTVRIGTLAGAIHAAQEGAGVAVIPTHCVLLELAARSLKEGSFVKKPVSNPVHIVRRRGERLPARAETILNMLRTAKQQLG